jgi:Protein of unknown function (DUF2911)
MSSKLLRIAGLLVCSVSSALAQATRPTGAFITRLGTDTVAVERYVVSKSQIEGDVLNRSNRVVLTHYVAELGPRGEIRRVVVSSRIPGDTSSSPRTLLVQEFSDTAAFVRVMRNGRPDTVNTGWRAYRGRNGVPNIMMEPASYGMYEQVLRTTKLGGDSVGYVFVSTARGAQPSLWLMRNGRDSVAFTNTIFPGWTEMARVDSRGRILAVNSGRTTVKTIATRVADVNIDALAKLWKANETAHGVRNMSPTDTTRATIGTANLQVIYSRPSRRGRQIFGTDVVPWNTVWRTGANAATELTTSSDLMLGQTLVPAGKYTLFTLPTASGTTLIISKKTGEWGTDYEPASDLARLPLTTTMLTMPAERFTIGIDPAGAGGVLRMAWDDRQFTIPFTVK